MSQILEDAQPVPASPAGKDDMKIYREIASGVQAPEPVACVSYENHAGHECRKAVLFSNGLELSDGTPLYARPIRPVSGASSALVEKLRHGVQMARLRGPGFTPHLTCDDVAGIADVLAGVQPLTTSPVADQEPPSVHDNAELIADLEGLANEIQLDYVTDAIDSAIQALRWQPEFDAMAPKQEALLVEFCAEISKGAGLDPVRLLEMAEALYLAERDSAPGSQK
jgi:hypothetical protein